MNRLSAAAATAGVSILTLITHTCEREPNDTLATATPLSDVRPDGGPRGDGWLAFGELRAGDVDHFSFPANAGDVVSVALRDDTNGELADGVLALYGPGSDEPLVVVDDVRGDLAPRLLAAIAEGGRHQVAIAGFGDEELDGDDHDQRFAYRLTVAVSPERRPLRESDRDSRNDDPASPDRAFVRRAELVPRGAAILEGRLVPGDVDHFLVPLPGNSQLVAAVYDDAGGEFNDPRLRLAELDGEPLAEDDDAGPGLLPRVSFASDAQDPPRQVVLSVEGYDPDPGDDVPHEESFRYRLVVSIEDRLP